MGKYRPSRNIEASFIDFIKTQLVTDGWSNVNTEKTFTRAYEIDLPTICIRVGTTEHEKAEIGGDSTIRTPLVLIDIFGSGDGNRLDLKDWLIAIMKSGLVYYDYEIENGVVKNKIANGRIRVINIDDTPIEFDTEKDRTDIHDRYRHLLTLTCSLGRLEA